ncbi:MAG: DUF5686 and carboxypeptidase regulatory-like domain-containing protein [Adhaeribacter sp.]
MFKYILLFLFCIVSLVGQATVLKGRVTDENGEALPFATLYIKNTTIGTATNEQGYYQINLEPGSYQIVFQYVGYRAKTEIIEISDTEVVRNVSLQLDVFSLKEVEIKANEKDPAYAIVKAAISRRKYHLNEVLAYNCRVYTKGMGRLTNVPNKVLGVRVNDLKPGIVYLSESVSQLSFRQPNKMHERMISSKVSGDSKGFSFNRASRVTLNFYENLLRVQGLSERAFVSPVANNALLFYRYKLIGATQENGQFINKIKVTPIRRNDPAFEGYIYIIDDEWRLHSLDLRLTQAHQIEYADTLRIRQSFGPVANNIWMLLSQKLTLNFDSFGFKGNGYFTTVYSNYKVEPAHRTAPEPAATAPIAAAQPESQNIPAESKLADRKKELKRRQKARADALFNKKEFKSEVMVVEKDANKRDSAYWDEIRPIPLTEEEQKDYVVKDSIKVVQESRPYKDSLDKKSNKFEVANLFLSGYRYRNSFKSYSYALDPLIAFPEGSSLVQYNTVEGTVINARVQYQHWNEETNKNYEITPTLRYGFANQRWQAQVRYNYDYNPSKFSQVSGGFGRFVAQFNNADPIGPFWNSLYTLAREQNYLKLYQRNFITANHRTEVANGLFIISGVEYADRSPLQNAADYTLKDYPNRQFTSNIPVNAELADASFSRHQALLASLTLQFRPGQRYITRPNEKWVLRSRYPTFRLNYTKGFNNILSSDVNYDRVQFGLNDRLNFGLVGNSNYSVQAGTFLNKKQLYFIDYKHFGGNRTIYAGNFGGFQLLDYYRYSTTHGYFEAHFSHEFNGFIFNKVPLFRKLKWQEVVNLNYLRTEKSQNYLEVGVGVEHIFKILRVDFVTSFQSKEKVGSGIRIGFGF